MKKTARDKAIEYLSKCKTYRSTHQIATGAKVPYNTIKRVMNEMEWEEHPVGYRCLQAPILCKKRSKSWTYARA